MKVWSIQKRAVVDILQRTGFYQPDFSKSDYLKELPNQDPLYTMLLDAFNVENCSEFPGLIFSFRASEGNTIYSPADISQFYDFIQQHQAAILSLWRNLRAKDTVILELDYEDNFNPIMIDINDYQFMMPPVMETPPYTIADFYRLRRNLFRGEITQSIFPSHIIQTHVPYIRSENVAGVYEMFDLVPPASSGNPWDLPF